MASIERKREINMFRLAGAARRNLRIRNEYDTNPKRCQRCDKVIEYKQRGNKFCSHTCAAIVSNSGRKKPKKCKTCGIEISSQQINCDTCKVNSKYTAFEKLGSDQTRKRRLLEERGNRCECCGLDMWLNKKINLTMDHTDGNPDNCSKANLKLLCWNCHSITPTFGARNKNSITTMSSRNIKRRTARRKILDLGMV